MQDMYDNDTLTEKLCDLLDNGKTINLLPTETGVRVVIDGTAEEGVDLYDAMQAHYPLEEPEEDEDSEEEPEEDEEEPVEDPSTLEPTHPDWVPPTEG